MRQQFLPFFIPSIEEEEINEVIDTLKSGWVSTGPKTLNFEKDFSSFIKASSALAVSSCTAALHLSLVIKNIKPNDEIITTPLTFAATANIIEHVGATPIFVDVEKDTLNIDPKKIESAITSKTKGIIIVHYAGHSCEMDQIMEIAKLNSLFVIEDVAHGLGGKYNDQFLGTFGNFGAFSFYANKNITSAEGGMLIGNNDDIEKARILSLHGINKEAWKRYKKEGSWYYDITHAGYKYNMTDISASLGLQQLKKINRFQQRRHEVVDKYNKSFHSNEYVEIPTCRSNITHAWHLYPLRLNLERLTISRKRFIELLTEKKIGSSVHFIPLHIQPYYRNKYHFHPDDFPTSYSEYLRLISLPLFPKMSDQDVTDVIEAINEIIIDYKK